MGWKAVVINCSAFYSIGYHGSIKLDEGIFITVRLFIVGISNFRILPDLRGLTHTAPTGDMWLQTNNVFILYLWIFILLCLISFTYGNLEKAAQGRILQDVLASVSVCAYLYLIKVWWKWCLKYLGSLQPGWIQSWDGHSVFCLFLLQCWNKQTLYRIDYWFDCDLLQQRTWDCFLYIS